MGDPGGHDRQTPGGEGDRLPVDHPFPAPDNVDQAVFGVRRLAVRLDPLDGLVHHEHDLKISRLFRNRHPTAPY